MMPDKLVAALAVVEAARAPSPEQRADAVLLLCESEFGQSGRDVRVEAIKCEIEAAVEKARAEAACHLCHCCGEKRHDDIDPCVSCEAARAEGHAAGVAEENARVLALDDDAKPQPPSEGAFGRLREDARGDSHYEGRTSVRVDDLRAALDALEEDAKSAHILRAELGMVEGGQECPKCERTLAAMEKRLRVLGVGEGKEGG